MVVAAKGPVNIDLQWGGGGRQNVNLDSVFMKPTTTTSNEKDTLIELLCCNFLSSQSSTSQEPTI